MPKYLAFNGLEMTASNGFLEGVIEGVEELPGVEHGGAERPHHHGEWEGEFFAAARTVTFECELVPPQGESTAGIRRKILQALALNVPGELVVRNDIGDFLLYARVKRRFVGMAQNYYAATKFVVEFHCSDPRLYGEALHSDRTLIVSDTTPGVPYDFDFPAPYRVTGSNNGTILVNNEGNADTLPKYILRGPLTNPTVTLYRGGSSATLRVLGNVGVNGVMVLDPREGRVTLDETDRASMTRGILVSEMSLPVGISEVSLGGAGTGSLEVQWRDAWL